MEFYYQNMIVYQYNDYFLVAECVSSINSSKILFWSKKICSDSKALLSFIFYDCYISVLILLTLWNNLQEYYCHNGVRCTYSFVEKWRAILENDHSHNFWILSKLKISHSFSSDYPYHSKSWLWQNYDYGLFLK